MSQCLMNPNFWLLYGLSDIYIMLMDYSVVLYSLSNHVIINWFLIFLTLINIYWIYFHSYIIVIIVLNWCSWPWVRAYGLELDDFSFGIKVVRWSGVCCPNSLYFSKLDFNYIVIGMFNLWWWCYVNKCGLVGVTLCNMMIMSLSALFEVLWWFV